MANGKYRNNHRVQTSGRAPREGSWVKRGGESYKVTKSDPPSPPAPAISKDKLKK